MLEQRLVEFHGSLISHRLHARRYGAQSHHFLESMKSYFERFLRVSSVSIFLSNPLLTLIHKVKRRKLQLFYPFRGTLG